MDPGPGGDHEISVTLSPPLREWIGERSSALGIPQDQLLEQLLAAHRDVAERDGDVSAALSELADIESAVDAALEDRLDIDSAGELEAELEGVQGQVDDIDAKLTNHVEDLRGRVLQLRDAVSERAPADHSHAEHQALGERVETIAAEIEEIDERTASVDESIWWISTEIGTVNDRLETIESRLNRLAHAVVTLKRHSKAAEAEAQAVNELKKAANKSGTDAAECAGCSNTVRIDLLSEPLCPHCDRRLYGLEEPESWRGWFKNPTLTVVDEPTTSTPEREADE